MSENWIKIEDICVNAIFVFASKIAKKKEKIDNKITTNKRNLWNNLYNKIRRSVRMALAVE